MERIGVYICHCGTNIAGTVDVKEVTEFASGLDDVVVAKDYEFMCSDPGQNMIREDIEEENLTKVVVASCSPTLHEETFMRVVESAGLNQFEFQMANIREHCSWVTDDRAKATEKAKRLVDAAVNRVRKHEPLEVREVDVIPRTLVVGGGIAGIEAALEVAESGKEVWLVEKSPSIGGHMAQLDKTFPTLDCSSCILTPKMGDVGRHPNIRLLTYSEVESVDGFPGNFEVKIRKRSRYIDEDKCTACGECIEVCPIAVPNEFNEGLDDRPAIYRPFPQAVPNTYTIERKGVSPCKDSCPADVDVQGYIALLKEGKYKEAVDLHRESNPFPSICGRVCHHPCEDECNRSELDDPVSIKLLKRFIADRVREEGERRPEEVKPTKEKRVAVVGGGPSGLTCALRLLEKGYQVTVYEREENPGGMLSSCIPNYRITDEEVDYEIGRILDRGVDLECGKKIGEDVSLRELTDEFDAVYLGIGAQEARELPVEGADAEPIYLSLDFLRKAKLGEEIEDLGNNVLVVGGGNVAADCAKTAKRMGAEEVGLVCLETRDLSSHDRMPAYDWEIEEIEEEGIAIHDSLGLKRILSEKGKVSGVEAMTCTSVYTEEGEFAPRYKEDEITYLEADTLIIAIGQACDLDGFESLEATAQGTIKVDGGTLETSVKGVFAGGDVIRGPASVVEAIKDGNEAANSIDRYLEGREFIREEEAPHVVTFEEVDIGRAVERERVPTPKASPRERIQDFRSIEIGLSEEEALREAERCLNCAVCSSCKECEKVCEPEAIDYSMEDEIIEEKFGNMIVATGYDLFNPKAIERYGYRRHDDVYTALEVERMIDPTGPTGGEVLLSDGTEPGNVVIIHCVGSRDKDYHEYCSRVCCMYSMKLAHLIKDETDAEIHELYNVDLRTSGKGSEEFYNRVEEEGIDFLRGKAEEIEVEERDGRLLVECGENIKIPADMVVLSPAMEAKSDADEMAKLFSLGRSEDGFFMERHPKLAPVNTMVDGIFLAGACQGPKDIPDSVAQGAGAAEKAIAMIDLGSQELDPYVSEIDEDVCSGCQTCITACPYNAIEFDEEKAVSKVEEALCMGCGICSMVCRTGAARQSGFTDEQLASEIVGILE